MNVDKHQQKPELHSHKQKQICSIYLQYSLYLYKYIKIRAINRDKLHPE